MLNLKASEKDAVKLGKYPQRFCDKFAPGAPEIPAALPENGVPLPSGAAVCSCVTDDGALWLGNENGLVRYAPGAYFRDEVSYFSAPRYLADNDVKALLADGSGVWVRTETGVSHIYDKPMTFAEKAAIYDARITERQTRHGFVTNAVLSAPGNFTSVKHYSQDNDGLWTAMYAVGACYEYAVTGSEDAHKRAVSAANAVLSLVDVTGIKGYPARSFILPDEELPKDGFWILNSDASVTWKSDTSSDELVGHFLLYLIASELLPDEDIKIRCRKAAADICDYIIANDYYLIDVTGKPTTWGNWNIKYFNSLRGYPDTCLNAAELLSHIKVAWHLTGEERFASEYRKLAYDLGYADLCVTYFERKTNTINYSDEELAYLTYLPLVLLEEDPHLRSRYRDGMSEWWVNIQRELNPLWTYIYKLMVPELDYDMEGCLWTLRRLPIDMFEYPIDNTGRKDIKILKERGRHREIQTDTLLAPDERPVMKWNGNPFRLTGGGNALSEEPGTVFTLPYWLGRYYGFLVEE